MKIEWKNKKLVWFFCTDNGQTVKDDSSPEPDDTSINSELHRWLHRTYCFILTVAQDLHCPIGPSVMVEPMHTGPVQYGSQ